jgi:recombination protein RecT
MTTAKESTLPATNGMQEKTRELMERVKKNGNLSGLGSDSIAQIFGQYKLQIAQALPKHLTADRILQMATTLVSKNPELKKCSTASVIGAIMQASILGFRPVEALGYCYIIPYGGQAQFQIGYRGFMDLARRSGQIKSIHAFAVYKGDAFKYALGLHPVLEHTPSDSQKDVANLTHVYAVAHFKDGGYNFVILTRKEIESLRLRNSMQKSAVKGAWATDYEAMACAKAIKQLAKYLPLSDEMMTAIQTDEAIISPESFASDGSGTTVEINTPDYDEAVEVSEENNEVTN